MFYLLTYSRYVLMMLYIGVIQCTREKGVTLTTCYSSKVSIITQHCTGVLLLFLITGVVIN